MNAHAGIATQPLSEPILISGETPPWRGQRLACLSIVAVGAVVACIPRGDPPIGGIIVVVGVVLWIGLDLHGLWLRQKRRWLKIAENGFEISRGDDHRWYEDRHVTALACSHHSVLTNGCPSGTLRRFQVWLLEEHRPLVMENVFPLGEPDPLAGLIHRLVEVAMDRARQLLPRLFPAARKTGSATPDGSTPSIICRRFQTRSPSHQRG